MKRSSYIRKRKTTTSTQKYRRNGRTIRSVLQSHNFSDIEDNTRAFQIIGDIATNAGNNAALEAKAAGLSRVYIRNHRDLVKVSPKGEETIMIPKSMRSTFYIKVKPHTVFYAVK